MTAENQVVRLAFAVNVLAAIKKQTLTPNQVERRIAVARKRIDRNVPSGICLRNATISRKALAAVPKFQFGTWPASSAGEAAMLLCPQFARLRGP
jgi:hypothetical protein